MPAAASLPAVLPSIGRRPFDVENVVDDLEREADLARVPLHGAEHQVAGAAAMTAPAWTEAQDERAGLAAVHLAQRGLVQRSRAGRGGLQVEGLAADHPGCAGGVGHERDRREPPAGQLLGRDRGGCGRFAREQRERLRQQRVAGENRHALAEDDVGRRAAAAQRVVVHRGQIVVDERIGVDQFQRARGGKREGVRVREAFAAAFRDRLRGREDEHRPQPLAAGEEAVAHRLADDGGCLAGRRHEVGRAPRRRSVAAGPATSADRSRAALTGTCHPRRPASAPSDAGAGFTLAAVVEDLDAGLRFFELRVAEARELHAALVELDRFLESQVPLFHLLDDGVELRAWRTQNP